MLMLNVPNSIPSYASPHLSPIGLESVQKPLRKFTGGRPKFMRLDRWTTIGAVEWTDKTGMKHPDWRFISRPDNKDSVSAIPFWIAPDGSIILGLKDELRQTFQRGVLGGIDSGENPCDPSSATETLNEQYVPRLTSADNRNVVVRELKEELGILAGPDRMLTPSPRAALLDSVSDCLNMSIPFYMGSEADMANVGEQELEPDLPALLTLLKASGHPCTQELSSFIFGYMFARLEDKVKARNGVGEGLDVGEVREMWDGMLQPGNAQGEDQEEQLEEGQEQGQDVGYFGKKE